MVALGNGAQQSVEQDVRSAGTNIIQVNAGNYTRGGEESRIATGLGSATTLTPEDAAAIGRGVAGIKSYAAGVKLRGWIASGRAAVLRTGARHRCRRSRRCSAGGSTRAGSSRPTTSPRGVRSPCSAARPRDQIFGDGVEPSGRRSTIHGQSFTVVGITRHGRSRSDRDGVRAVHRAAGRAAASRICTRSRSRSPQAGEASRIAEESPTLLRARHAAHIDAARREAAPGGVTGNQMPAERRGRRSRRLHREDAVVGSADEGAVHVGRGVHPGQHAEARRGEPGGNEAHAPARRHDDDGAARQHRRDLAGRRRHRHHEHHAGGGDRADPRDRRPPRRRRAPARRARCSFSSRRWRSAPSAARSASPRVF